MLFFSNYVCLLCLLAEEENSAIAITNGYFTWQNDNCDENYDDHICPTSNDCQPCLSSINLNIKKVSVCILSTSDHFHCLHICLLVLFSQH